MNSGDIPAADTLRELAGWNQTRRDWERFLTVAPAGCFVAEWEDRVVGTATTTAYGTDLAWVGMVLVHPEYRRRGIGRALLEKCLGFLGEQGIRCIKLDATPAGHFVYEGLGFRDEWTLTRWAWEGAGREVRLPANAVGSVRAADAEFRLRRWRDSAAQLIGAFDAVAFGCSRARLLSLLAGQSGEALVCEDSAGQLLGYGMRREGARAEYLGPVVAVSWDVASRLIEELLRGSNGRPVYWDLPDVQAEAVDWARRRGFGLQRSLTRMFLGANEVPGDPRRVFGLAGPEVG